MSPGVPFVEHPDIEVIPNEDGQGGIPPFAHVIRLNFDGTTYRILVNETEVYTAIAPPVEGMRYLAMGNWIDEYFDDSGFNIQNWEVWQGGLSDSDFCRDSGMLQEDADARYYKQDNQYIFVNLSRFNETRQPNTERPTFVVATIAITVDDSAASVSDDGEAIFQISPNNVSWQYLGSWRANIAVAVATSVTLKQSPTMFVVPEDYWYRIVNVTYSGTPVFHLANLTELSG
jgi:hypothetical protein